MADHGPVQYATATGNDLAEHESTYKGFVQLAYVGSALVASIVIGLAIGATTGRWLIAIPIIFVLAPIVAAYGLATGARAPSGIMVVISLLALGFATAG
jgi:Bacterial aa3 type cytochrome c oxidase subunit IV